MPQFAPVLTCAMDIKGAIKKWIDERPVLELPCAIIPLVILYSNHFTRTCKTDSHSSSSRAQFRSHTQFHEAVESGKTVNLRAAFAHWKKRRVNKSRRARVAPDPPGLASYPTGASPRLDTRLRLCQANKSEQTTTAHMRTSSTTSCVTIQ